MKRIYVTLLDGRPVAITVHYQSRLLRWLQRLHLVHPRIVGFAPWSIHMRDSIEETRLEHVCHEMCHMLDRETSPWPRFIMHPIRSLWHMRHGYMNSPLEKRAYAVQRLIAERRYERVILPAELYEDLGG
jgi:hypothetical protein